MIWTGSKAAWVGRLLGWTVLAGSLVFICSQLWHQAPWELAAAHSLSLAVAAVSGVLLYGLAGFLLSGAWCRLLGADLSPESRRLHHLVYGRTQVAKYLPGNVFHLVGRQVAGRELGHSQPRLALASLGEAGLLVLIAGVLSVPLVWRLVDPVLLAVLGSLAALLLFVAVKHGRRHRDLWSLAPRHPVAGEPGPSHAARLLYAGSLYAIFFMTVSGIYWVLAWSVSNHVPAIDPLTCISVVAFAWLIGFITPGSSAGIGIREAILIAALESSLGAAAAGLVALSLRGVSIGGDLMFLGFCRLQYSVLNRPQQLPLGSDFT